MAVVTCRNIRSALSGFKQSALKNESHYREMTNQHLLSLKTYDIGFQVK